MLASALRDETVKLWDVGTGAALQTLEGDTVVEIHISLPIESFTRYICEGVVGSLGYRRYALGSL